jgi:ribosomal protein L35AE/L33A
MPQEFIVRGATNAVLQIASTALPKTILFSQLTPVEGTLPAFSNAPLVYILSAGTTRYLDVDTETNTSFRIIASTTGPTGTYTVDVGIINLDAVTSIPASETPVGFMGYCTSNDVEKDILNLKQSTGSGKSLDFTVRRLFIAQIYGEINAALSEGLYQAPVTNVTKQVITEALVAGDTVNFFTVQDGTKFSAGKIVRIHGQNGSVYNDEFTHVVSVSGNVVGVEFLKNSYNAKATIELANDASLYLRSINSIGAALRALGGLIIGQAQSENSRANQLESWYDKTLTQIRLGKLVLDGLSYQVGILKSFQDGNPNDEDVTGAPIFRTSSKW